MNEYSYMVLDHAAPIKAERLDGYGRLYVHLPAAHLDEYRLTECGRVQVPSADGDERHEVEIPLYRRDAMPDGWPGRWVKGQLA